MDFIDLAVQQRRIREQIENNINKVLAHGKYIMGPEVKALEERLAGYVGVKHAVGCASGTDALQLALMALDLKPGDAVFTTPFTFVATVEVICLLGATPIFVDIDPDTFNMDPEKLEQAIHAVASGRDSDYPLPPLVPPSILTPKGVIAVDLFGLPADYDSITRAASSDSLFVIEDAAQSFGAEYKEGKACSFGDIGCTSFFPAKPLGCYGDGGMCFTQNPDLAEALDSLRVHGKGSHKYENVRIGVNGRLDTLQAAILLAKFDIFEEEVKLRRQVAQRYQELFAELDNEARIVPPRNPSGFKSVWAQYSILTKDENHRGELEKRLKGLGIPTAIYYPNPLHLQPALAMLDHKAGDFPISENCSSRILSLPMHPYLESADQETIVRAILNC